MHISKKLYFHNWNIKRFLYFIAKIFIFNCQGTELRVKHYTTKCKICFSSSINFVYNKKKIHFFLEWIWPLFHLMKWKNVFFHSWLRHSWNIHFFSLHSIKSKSYSLQKFEYPLSLLSFSGRRRKRPTRVVVSLIKKARLINV